MESVAERRYRDLVELSHDGIVLHTEGRIAYANRAARRLLGVHAPDTLLDRAIDDFLEPPYLAVVHDELLQPGSSRTPFVERHLKRLDGSIIDVEVSAVPFVFEDRPSVQLVLRDIRERVKARSALLWAESQFRTLAEQMPFVMWTSDEAGRVASVIGDVSSPFGARAVAAMQAHEALPLDEAVPPIEQAEAMLEQGEQPTFQVGVGGRCYALRLEPLSDPSSEAAGRLGVAFDITAWVRTQELLRDALRLEAVGHLAGGVAHEINNVLAIISGNAALLDRRAPGGSPEARQILEATQRAAEVTRNLLAFAMRDVHRPERLSVNKLASEVAETVARTAAAQVVIDVRLAPDLPDVLGDAVSLSRALMSLCVNALDAMPAGGRLTIETGRVASRGPRPESDPGRVRIKVTDTGRGMSEADRKRAFEPFFSADSSRRHVGLGLSMAQGVVTQHKGRIRLKSDLGVGTTVTILLPGVGPTPAPSAPSRPAARADVSRRPKALVVDDEPMLRAVSSALVATLGYTAVQAADGAEAVERFRASPHDFAFVLLDVLMPGMSGIEVLWQLFAIDPDVRVVLCTGYPRGEIGADIFARGTVEYLGKPFARNELVELVAKVTGRGAEAEG